MVLLAMHVSLPEPASPGMLSVCATERLVASPSCVSTCHTASLSLPTTGAHHVA